MRTLPFVLCALPSALAAASDADLLAAYTQLRDISLDPSRVAVVENVELKKNAATFRFKSGNLYLFKPVLDRAAGAVFVGDAVFSFKPPTEIEQNHLARLNGESQLDEPFQTAVLLFTESTLEELQPQLKFRPGDIPSKAAGLIGDLHNTFRNDLKSNIEARILAGLASTAQPLFLAHISGQKHGRLVFSIDPTGEEDVSLLHYSSGRSGFEPWTSFTSAGTPSAAQRALVHTTSIDIDTEIEKSGHMQAESSSEFTALAGGPRLIPVLLAPTLRVSKITGCGGADLKFVQEQKKKDADLWAILPQPLAKGATCTWKFAYAGDEVIRNAGDGNFFVGARESWYPKISNPAEVFNDRSLYHMKFRVPRDYTLVATGKPLKNEAQGKFSVSEWETEVPYTVAGFNYGRYKTKTQRAGDRDVTVYANPDLTGELRSLQVELEQNPDRASQLGITTGGFNTTGLMNQTLVETINSLNLFTAYFGPIPYTTISVTQQPVSYFGQSWPTLIFMPYTAFLDATVKNQLKLDQGHARQFYQEVGSHEIAHQWWGHAVSWNTYHDQWLSEGFAQFSAGLYIQKAQGEKKYRTFLETDRQLILAPLYQSTTRANDAGPIWLGQRLETEKTQGAYRLVYTKGGFVLHMLRMLLYDYARNDDSRFMAMMKDFVETYYNRSASTEDFKAICDKHFKNDMGWFFKQWVYGTDLPKITVEYSFADDPAGAVWKVDVRQQNVPDGFISVLPFILRTKAGVLSGRLPAQHPATHLELKLKEKPDTVEINPLYGWLCELEVKKR